MIHQLRMENQILHRARDLLTRAWQFRYAQDIEQTLVLMAEIRHLLGNPSDLFAHQFSDQEGWFEQSAELLLLECSIARADRDSIRAAQILNSVENAFRHKGHRPNTPLYLQRGLTFLSQSDYSAALEQFLGARSCARNPFEKFWALGNSLTCMEYLGLPYEHTWMELQKLGRTLPLSDAALSQIYAFEGRLSFNEGSLDFLKKKTETKTIQQIHYFKLWVRALPFVTLKNSRKDFENFLSHGRLLYLFPYRSRTLQGLWHNDDSRITRWSDFSDRLYLWTWQWLQDPEVFPFERLEPLLEQISQAGSLLGRLSPVDFQKIRNALGWLALFDLDSQESLERILQAHRPTFTTDQPLYAFEYELQHSLRVTRDFSAETGKIELERVQKFTPPKEFDFESIVFSDNIKQWILGSRPKSGVTLFVELTLGEIQVFKTKGKVEKPKIISQAMANAIALLHERPLVSYGEFVRVCFGYYRYDPVIHELKVLNLLARIRDVLPSEFQLGVKAGNVRLSVTGNGWEKVQIQRANPRAKKLLSSTAWKQLLVRTQSGIQDLPTMMKPQLLLRQLHKGQEVTRKDIEQLTGKSRATSNRLIAEWIKSGMLKPVGNAKNTKYQIRSEGKDL